MNYSKNKSRIKRISVVAMFCALAYIFMLFIRIPVQFLTLDIKDSLVILAGLLFGPLSATAISIIVPFVELITISGTGIYGFIMNVLSTLAFSVTASIIYKYKKTYYGAILSLVSGVLAMTATMMIANLFITPYYMHVSISNVATLIPKLFLPFNLTKAFINASIVLILYKPLSAVLKKTKIIVHHESSKKDEESRKKSIKRYLISTAISIVIIALSLIVIFFVLNA